MGIFYAITHHFIFKKKIGYPKFFWYLLDMKELVYKLLDSLFEDIIIVEHPLSVRRHKIYNVVSGDEQIARLDYFNDPKGGVHILPSNKLHQYLSNMFNICRDEYDAHIREWITDKLSININEMDNIIQYLSEKKYEEISI